MRIYVIIIWYDCIRTSKSMEDTMKKFKRLLSLIFAVLMVLGTVSTAFAANVTFTDVSGHWAWTSGQIPYLVEKGVLNGYKESNGTYTFKPDVPVTRAEFIKMLDETFGLTKEAAVNYTDVKPTDWFYKYYLRASAQGYLLNYGNKANPDGYIPREEACALLARYLNLSAAEKASASTFTDYASVSSYYKDYVLQAVDAGLFNGYEESDGTYTFRPKDTLTRAEALTILYRAAGCIFNVNSYSRNTGAFTTNNVVTKGDVVIQGVTFTGRNIITEGATSGKITFSNCKFTGTLYIRGSAEVTFDNCTVGEVISTGGAKVILSNKTKIEAFTLKAKSDITGYAGTEISELIVEKTAAGSSHTGSGDIARAVINASGFRSTTLPTSFDIGSGLSASFASATYTGASNAGDVFTLYPFASLYEGFYYINLISSESGDINYYYTNSSTLPSASDFAKYYATSDYAGYFTVAEGKHTAGKTYSEAAVKSYNYIALQLQIDNNVFAPVIISNTVATDAGFKVAPHVDTSDNMKIVLQTSVTGTLYWFYTNEGNQLSQMAFLEEFDDTESALRGEQTLTANKSISLSLEEKYVKNYDYVAFMYQSATGVYYIPVAVTVGDNGFKNIPEVTSLGVIECTPNVTGSLYLYYSDSDVLPTAESFLDEYSSAELRRKIEVKKNTDVEIKYDLKRIEDYPYIILAIRNSSGEFLAPVAVSVSLTTGFKTTPEAVDEKYVTFKTEKTGTVKWYYTNDDAVPTIEDFNTEYDSSSPIFTCGTVSASASSTTEINFTTSASKYEYIALMFVASDGTEHFPVIVNMGVSSAKDFSTKPFVSGGKIYYEVDSDGKVYYYFTSSSSSVSAANFENEWIKYATDFKGSQTVSANTMYSFSLPSEDLLEYVSYAVIAYYDLETKKYSTPVVVSVEELANTSNSGINSTFVTDNSISVIVNESGTLFYYFTNTSGAVKPTAFKAYYDLSSNARGSELVSANKAYDIPINSNYKYIVLAIGDGMNGYMFPVTVDVSTPTTSVSTTSYGFNYDSSDRLAAMQEHKLSVTPYYNGTISVTFIGGGNIKSVEKVTATPNTSVQLDWSSLVSSYSRFYSDKEVEIRIQMNVGETEFKVLTINPVY